MSKSKKRKSEGIIIKNVENSNILSLSSSTSVIDQIKDELICCICQEFCLVPFSIGCGNNHILCKDCFTSTSSNAYEVTNYLFETIISKKKGNDLECLNKCPLCKNKTDFAIQDEGKNYKLLLKIYEEKNPILFEEIKKESFCTHCKCNHQNVWELLKCPMLTISCPFDSTKQCIIKGSLLDKNNTSVIPNDKRLWKDLVFSKHLKNHFFKQECTAKIHCDICNFSESHDSFTHEQEPPYNSQELIQHLSKHHAIDQIFSDLRMMESIQSSEVYYKELLSRSDMLQKLLTLFKICCFKSSNQVEKPLKKDIQLIFDLISTTAELNKLKPDIVEYKRILIGETEEEDLDEEGLENIIEKICEKYQVFYQDT